MNTVQLPPRHVAEAPPTRRALSATARVGALTGALALASLPAALFHDAIGRAAALHDLAASPHPYFVPAHAALLYGAVPAVVLSAGVLLLAPGILLALAAGAAARIERWLLAALAISLVVVSGAAGLVQGILGRPLVGAAFVGVLAVCGALAAVVAALSARRRALAWPAARDLPGLVPLLLLPAALVAVLAPKFLWEAFDGDGAHAFETARLLLHQALPFWDQAATNLASFPGITSMTFAFPASWMIRLFGPVEAAARLPFVLFLPAVYAGIVELARAGRAGRARDPGQGMRWLVWAGLVPYTLAMAFSASYSPYSADLAMPATQDTLLIALLLAALAALVDGRMAGFAGFAALALLSLPNGLMLLGLFLLASLVAWRPLPARRLAAAGALVVGLYAATLLLPPIIGALGLPPPGREYAGLSMLRYFAYLQWSEVGRLLYVIVPGGIVPALALVAWRRQDGPARALTLAIVAYFLFFYVQGLTALHHFSPIMVLPIPVFWRMVEGQSPRARRWLAGAAAVGALAATVLSLPRVAAPYTTARAVGETVADRFGGYERGDARVFGRELILQHVFPSFDDPRLPARSFGGAAVVWSYYAAHAPADAAVNYLIEPASAPAPAGWRRLVVEGDAALDVRSDAVMAAQRALRPATDRGAAIYTVRRGALFSSVPDTRRISTLKLLQRVGIDLTPLAARVRPHGNS